MKTVDGWKCPDLLSGPGNYRNRFLKQLEIMEPHLHGERKGSAVMAGGHIGVVPIGLAGLFESVYCFEPDENNFDCLCANIAQCDDKNIFASRAILGAKRGLVGLNVSEKSTGQHVVSGKPGRIPTFLIDDLGLEDCELIFLDVEGYEYAALLGAAQTIGRSKPMIVAEENKRCLAMGYRYGDLEKLLASFDYRVADREKEDIYFV